MCKFFSYIFNGLHVPYVTIFFSSSINQFNSLNFNLIIFSSLFFTGTFAEQQFEQQPDYNEVNPGQEARLTCKIFHKKGHCSWQKDNKVN